MPKHLVRRDKIWVEHAANPRVRVNIGEQYGPVSVYYHAAQYVSGLYARVVWSRHLVRNTQHGFAQSLCGYVTLDGLPSQGPKKVRLRYDYGRKLSKDGTRFKVCEACLHALKKCPPKDVARYIAAKMAAS